MSDRQKKVVEALEKISKKLGKDVIADNKSIYDVIPSELANFDIASGIGGIPKGRVIEFYGPPSSGKTMLFQILAGNCQKRGGLVAWVDAEMAWDSERAKQLGVDVDNNFNLFRPETGEDCFEIVDALLTSGVYDMICVDSLARLTPRAELEGNMGDSHMGLQARLISQAFRKLVAKVFKSNCALCLINQERMKIGIVFGSPKNTTGGESAKFYSSMRVSFRQKSILSEGSDSNKEDVGTLIEIKFVKNKCAIPLKTAELLNVFGSQFSKEKSLIESALSYGVLLKKGAWFSRNGENISQGEKNLINLLEKDKKLFQELYDEVINKFKNTARKDEIIDNVEEVLNENISEIEIEENKEIE